ncbi:MAG: Rab family GTPase [Candidatus Heimdallarchaeota archaeon]
MSDIKREFVFKVVLMGEGSVGKTSIRSQFMGVGFKSEYIKTIGADFASKAIILGDNKVHFQIWDLAGQAMYKHVRSSFYSGCKCGFLVCDLTSPETLEKLDQWVEEAVEHSGGFLKIFIILGNKHDLVDQIKVKQEDIDKLL